MRAVLWLDLTFSGAAGKCGGKMIVVSIVAFIPWRKYSCTAPCPTKSIPSYELPSISHPFSQSWCWSPLQGQASSECHHQGLLEWNLGKIASNSELQVQAQSTLASSPDCRMRRQISSPVSYTNLIQRVWQECRVWVGCPEWTPSRAIDHSKIGGLVLVILLSPLPLVSEKDLLLIYTSGHKYGRNNLLSGRITYLSRLQRLFTTSLIFSLVTLSYTAFKFPMMTEWK
jgi:hypothetical protein